MRALLVRVGADQSESGGSWNGPVDSRTWQFAYVPIPEGKETRSGFDRPYSELVASVAKFNLALPAHLAGRNMHLDPDFAHLSYGDQGRRAKQIRQLEPGDVLVFYASLRDVHGGHLVYALIGLIKIKSLLLATRVPEAEWNQNAHTRRILEENAQDVVVRGQSSASGKLSRCISFGEFRDKAYRVRPDILETWGGLSVKNGYLQRSAHLPEINDADNFMHWLGEQNVNLIQGN